MITIRDLVKVAHFPPLSYARSYIFEWVSAGMMMGMAVEILFAHDFPQRAGSFAILSQLGVPDSAFILFFLIFGAGRCVALFLNGLLYSSGPLLRGIGAAAGALIWGQLGIALFLSLVATHTLNIGIAMYFFMTVGEVISCYRAAGDAGNKSR